MVPVPPQVTVLLLWGRDIHMVQRDPVVVAAALDPDHLTVTRHAKTTAQQRRRVAMVADLHGLLVVVEPLTLAAPTSNPVCTTSKRCFGVSHRAYTTR